jgi:DNA-binding Lrp family transcriptional regulator
MPIDKPLTKMLEICGFSAGEKQESRLMSILGVILKLQQNPPIPLAFTDIYEQLQIDEPNSKLTKAWVHRLLKRLIESKLIRLDNPAAHRKKYIADVNTIMAGFELLKGKKIEELEAKQSEIEKELAGITSLDCGHLSKEFVTSITGRQEEVSSRIIRGVDELHNVLRFNMLEKAGKGDIIRATLLWAGPFIDEAARSRTQRFFEAAERGADVRYFVSTEVFRLQDSMEVKRGLQGLIGMIGVFRDLRARGKKFGTKLYSGPKTYNQVSFNNESMALVIAEYPVTATWITRQFNPDLIDNAVESFDKDWNKAKSIIDLTQEDFKTLGDGPEGLIRKIISIDEGEK